MLMLGMRRIMRRARSDGFAWGSFLFYGSARLSGVFWRCLFHLVLYHLTLVLHEEIAFLRTIRLESVHER